MLKNPPPNRMNPNRLASAKDKEKDKALDLKKQISNKSGENNNNINSKQSDKLVGKIINGQDKNSKPQDLKKVKSDVSSNDITATTEATCNSDNLNLLKKRESEKKELKNIENFFDKKKENINRYYFILFMF